MIIREAMLTIPVEDILNIDDVLKDLTAKDPKLASAQRFTRFKSNKDPNIYFYQVDKKARTISIPRNYPVKLSSNIGFKDFSTSGYKIPNTISDLFRFRTYQSEFFHKPDGVFATVNRGETDLIFKVPCGHGKTLMGLYMAYIYHVNTLVVVTTHQQARQYIKAVKRFFPAWSVGVFDEKKNTIFDITIATYDLLSDKRFDKKFFGRFGHVAFDEVHRIGASTYSGITEKAVCKFRTSLTATFRRKDKMHTYLVHHVGFIIEMEQQNAGALVVPLDTECTLDLRGFRTIDKKATGFKFIGNYLDYVVKDAITRIEVCKGMLLEKDSAEQTAVIKDEFDKFHIVTAEKHKFYQYGQISMSTIDSHVIQMPERNDLFFNLIKECYERGRVPLVLCKRKEFLFTMYARLKEAGIESGVISSTKAQEQVAHCKALGIKVNDYEKYCLDEAPVILGIDKIAQEGMDVERADTLILVHPIKDIEQAVGRIIREFELKKKPMVFYPMDDITPYENYYLGKEGAKKMFKELGHVIYKKCTLTGFINSIEKQ